MQRHVIERNRFLKCLQTSKSASFHLHFSKRMAEASQRDVENQSEEMIVKEASKELAKMENTFGAL